jgi:hypothetical protein
MYSVIPLIVYAVVKHDLLLYTCSTNSFTLFVAQQLCSHSTNCNNPHTSMLSCSTQASLALSCNLCTSFENRKLDGNIYSYGLTCWTHTLYTRGRRWVPFVKILSELTGRGITAPAQWAIRGAQCYTKTMISCCSKCQIPFLNFLFLYVFSLTPSWMKRSTHHL